MLWAGTELWCIIILGSIPPLRPLFIKLFYKATGSSLGRTSYGNGTGGNGTRGQYARGTQQENRSRIAEMEKSTQRKGKGLVSLLQTGNGSNEDIEEKNDKWTGIIVQSTFEVLETRARDETNVLEQGRTERASVADKR